MLTFLRKWSHDHRLWITGLPKGETVELHLPSHRRVTEKYFHKFHNQNAHVFRVLGVQKLRIVKKGTRHIYRSFMNLYLAYNIELHHDMLLFKQIMRVILLSILSRSPHYMLRSMLLMRKTNPMYTLSHMKGSVHASPIFQQPHIRPLF